MRKLIFTLILILAGYVGYMYFFGKGDDKAKAQIIVHETRDLGKAVSNSLEKLKSDSGEKGEEVKDNLRDLQKELKQIDPEKLNDENRKALEKLIKDVDEQLSADNQ